MPKSQKKEQHPHWKGGPATCFCLVCGSEFQRAVYKVKLGFNKFCSRACMGAMQGPQRRGRVTSEEVKRKISAAHMGKIFSTETRAKMSVAKKGKYFGKNNPAWKGGITPVNRRIRGSSAFRLWKKAVLTRDHHTCVVCGSKDHLHADHIQPFALFPELRFELTNGRTLCVVCHRTSSTWGGRVWKQAVASLAPNSSISNTVERTYSCEI
ncbi:MAG: hypothetical protein EBU46_11050 [Nitrosomonadaceae bacterium]|nr:hypothetical protein [Nitrosomonadaceae bacterium]